MQALIDAGANVNLGNNHKLTALHNAIENEQIKAATLLVQSGAENKRDEDGITPLELAQMNGLEDFYGFLLAQF